MNNKKCEYWVENDDISKMKVIKSYVAILGIIAVLIVKPLPLNMFS